MPTADTTAPSDPTRQLAVGTALFDTPDGRHIVGAPDGTYVELALNDADWASLRRVIAAAPGEQTGPPTQGRVADALTFLRGEGLLCPPPATATPGSAAPTAVRVHAVDDAASVGQALVALLRASTPAHERVDVTYSSASLSRTEATVAAHSDAGPATIVVACAAGLPDEAWTELDEQCSARGVAWHRCWSEGHTMWVGPFSVPGLSASYRDLRLRRLAASSWPDELEASWRSEVRRIAPWTPSSAASVAAMIADDVLGYLGSGSVDATARSWRGFDPSTRTWHHHAVLPVPVALVR